jgi:hypothetical protein
MYNAAGEAREPMIDGLFNAIVYLVGIRFCDGAERPGNVKSIRYSLESKGHVVRLTAPTRLFGDVTVLAWLPNPITEQELADEMLGRTERWLKHAPAGGNA